MIVTLPFSPYGWGHLELGGGAGGVQQHHIDAQFPEQLTVLGLRAARVERRSRAGGQTAEEGDRQLGSVGEDHGAARRQAGGPGPTSR